MTIWIYIRGGRETHCLVFEDLHWADDATLDLVAWLGRRIERTRTLLLASYRDDEIGPAHPLRRLLGALPAAQRIALPRLSADAVRALVGARAVDAQALHRISGGNPFFVTELLAVGAAQGVPPTVRPTATTCRPSTNCTCGSGSTTATASSTTGIRR